MANQDNNNFVEGIVDAQKQAIDTMVENTKKFTGGNAVVNEAVEKGTDWYKNWLDNQRSFFSKTTEQANGTAQTAKENVSQMTGFYQNWFNTQMNFAKQVWDMNTEFMKNATTNNNTAANMNPVNFWNNWMNNFNQTANWMNQSNNWMNQMQQMNFMNPESWRKASENYNNFFNQYQEMLNNSFSNWYKSIENGTVQDAYRNMVNAGEGFTRFAELWTPMWKAVQDNSFNMEMYKQWMNPAMYKDLMDKYFGFMPESTRQYMQNMTNVMQNGMSQFSQFGLNGYQQMRGMMGNMMPNGADFFGNAMNGYNMWSSMLNNAAAPMIKMITPNQYTKTMLEWNDIADRMMVFNIKNAELQFMMYNQGIKVMDQVAEHIVNKVKNGEEISSMMALYQEWLNISDKVYVSLFESEAYSKLMAEVSALQLKLRKDIDVQLEKMMVNIPVATRSELDELYKTIYDLKKQVRQLEKTLELEETNHTEEGDKATRKTTKK